MFLDNLIKKTTEKFTSTSTIEENNLIKNQKLINRGIILLIITSFLDEIYNSSVLGMLYKYLENVLFFKKTTTTYTLKDRITEAAAALDEAKKLAQQEQQNATDGDNMSEKQSNNKYVQLGGSDNEKSYLSNYLELKKNSELLNHLPKYILSLLKLIGYILIILGFNKNKRIHIAVSPILYALSFVFGILAIQFFLCKENESGIIFIILCLACIISAPILQKNIIKNDKEDDDDK